jgi:DNA-binding NtrC family response regulator
VSAGLERKKVLIIEEEPSARDDMRILLGSSGCECIVASNFQQPLATMDLRQFDAIVLDPQSSGSRATDVISRINEFHPDLLRRVVLITEEGRNSVVGDLAERYSLPRVQRKYVLQQLWGYLESMFRVRPRFRTSFKWRGSSPIASATRSPLGCAPCMIGIEGCSTHPEI